MKRRGTSVIGLWIVLGTLTVLLIAFIIGWTYLYLHIKQNLLGYLIRIFQEKPLFVVPRGQPVKDAEEVTIKTGDGYNLVGCFLRSSRPQKKGLILFGLEFGSNRWACVPYSQFLRDAGYDIFTFEFRNQGDSDSQPGYEPLQWVTEYEVRDMDSVLEFLKKRTDVPKEIGFFGISKGGSAGMISGSKDSFIRCFVTDGIFATHTTMLPYMRKWVAIYSQKKWIQTLVPDWYYRMFAGIGLKKIEKERGCKFPHLEDLMHKISPRALLMIHGEADNYIKPEMAKALFDRAKAPKEFWLVKKAKHNQAFQLIREEYQKRVLGFFETHLGNYKPHETNGVYKKKKKPAPVAVENCL